MIHLNRLDLATTVSSSKWVKIYEQVDGLIDRQMDRWMPWIWSYFTQYNTSPKLSSIVILSVCWTFPRLASHLSLPYVVLRSWILCQYIVLLPQCFNLHHCQSTWQECDLNVSSCCWTHYNADSGVKRKLKITICRSQSSHPNKKLFF